MTPTRGSPTWRGRWAGRILAAVLTGFALLAVSLAHVGCRPEESLPVLKAAWVETWAGASPHFPADVTRGGDLTVGTVGFSLRLTFDPFPAQTWIDEHLRVEGAAPTLELGSGEARLDFHASESAREVAVRLTSIRTPGGIGKADGRAGEWSLTVTMTPLPTETLDYRRDGDWLPYSGEFLTEKPAELRLTFEGELDRTSAEAALAGLPARVTWTGPATLVIRLDDLPGEMPLPVLHDIHGLAPILFPPLVVYAGEAPRLWVYDPVKGERRALAQIAPDIYNPLISPDGAHLFLYAYKGRVGSVFPWLVDTASGEARGLDEWWLLWLDGDRFLASLPSEDLAAVTVSGETRPSFTPPPQWKYVALSPDGRSLAVYVCRPDKDTGDSLIPWDLVVVDLDTGKETARLEELVEYYCTYSEGSILGGPAWSPDGKRIAAVGDLGLEKGSVVRVVDLETLEVETCAEFSANYLSWQWFSWSPDGRYWLAGNLLIEAAAPYSVKELGRQDGRPFWSPDGRWLCRTAGDWGELSIRDMRTGEERSLGRDYLLPCGWDESGLLYFIVWPDADHRYKPEY